MFALVDCNNFYASCERVNRPDLEGVPVAVLSNNDGCIIARSNEVNSLMKMMRYLLNLASRLKNAKLPVAQRVKSGLLQVLRT